MLNRFKNQEGFTLIELLVVILIIGILIAVAAPTFLGQQNKAKDSEIKQGLAVAYAAGKAETVDNNGNYPTSAALDTAISASEPQLNVIELLAAVGDDPTVAEAGAITQGQIGVYETAGGDGMCLVGRSRSGSYFTLEAHQDGNPTAKTVSAGTAAAPAEPATCD